MCCDCLCIGELHTHLLEHRTYVCKPSEELGLQSVPLLGPCLSLTAAVITCLDPGACVCVCLVCLSVHVCVCVCLSVCVCVCLCLCVGVCEVLSCLSFKPTPGSVLYVCRLSAKRYLIGCLCA